MKKEVEQKGVFLESSKNKICMHTHTLHHSLSCNSKEGRTDLGLTGHRSYCRIQGDHKPCRIFIFLDDGIRSARNTQEGLLSETTGQSGIPCESFDIGV